MHQQNGYERPEKKLDDPVQKKLFFQKVLNRKDPIAPQAKARAASKDLRLNSSTFESISRYFSPSSLFQPYNKDLLNASLDGVGRRSAERGSCSFEDAQGGLVPTKPSLQAADGDERELKRQVQVLRAKTQEQSLLIESLKRQAAISKKEKELMQAQTVSLLKRLNSIRDCEQENQRLRNCYQEILAKYLQAKHELVEKVSRLASFMSPKKNRRHSPNRDRLQTEPAANKRVPREEACLTFGSDRSSSAEEVSLQEESTSIAGQGFTERDKLLALQQKIAQLKKTNLELVEELKAAYLGRHPTPDAARSRHGGRSDTPPDRQTLASAPARRNKSLSSSLARQLTSILGKHPYKKPGLAGLLSDIESDIIEVKLRPEPDDEETPRFEQVSAHLGSNEFRSRSEQPGKRSAEERENCSRHINIELLSSDLRPGSWGSQQQASGPVDVRLSRARLVRQQLPSQFDCSSGYRRDWPKK